MRRAFFYGRIFKGAKMTEDNAHEFLKLKCERVIIVKYLEILRVGVLIKQR